MKEIINNEISDKAKEEILRLIKLFHIQTNSSYGFGN